MVPFGDNITEECRSFSYNEAMNREKEDNNMSVIMINKDNYNKEVIQSDKPVLLDFYADWCGPCRMAGPVVDQIAQDRPDIKVCKVNVDAAPEIAAAYHVMSIPMFAVIKDGRLAGQAVGFRGRRQIEEML